MHFARLLLAFCLVLATLPAKANDAAFEKAFGDDWLAQYWQFNPDAAVAVGYYRVAANLPAPDAARRAHYNRWLGTQIRRLAALDAAGLTPAARSDLAVLKNQLASERWSLSTLKSWQWNPAAYNVAEPIALLLSTPYAPEADRLRTVQARLLKVPAYYAAAKAAIRHPTREHTQLAIQQNAGAIDVLGASLERQVAGSALDANERTRFLAALKPARAAVSDYIAWLKALDAELAKDGNARSFRLGETLYEQKFAYEIQSGATGKALYERALAEKERLHARMAVLADQLWPKYFPGTTPPAHTNHTK